MVPQAELISGNCACERVVWSISAMGGHGLVGSTDAPSLAVVAKQCSHTGGIGFSHAMISFAE